MRRTSSFLTMVVLAALLLAACGGEEVTATRVPGTSVPPATVAATSTTEMTATEAPTSASVTATTSAPGIPVTGAGVPSQAITNLIGTSVCGLAGEQLGTVQDAVLDFGQKSVTYVIVDANGKAVPVPYSFLAKPRKSGTGTGTGSATPSSGGTDTLATETPSAGGAVSTATSSTTVGGTGTLATETPSAGGAVSTATSTTGTGTGTGAMGQQNCMTLTVSMDLFNKVPAFDPSVMPATGQSSADWDTNIMPYWVGGVENIATSTPEPTSTPSSADTTGTSTPSASGTTSSTATATTSASSSGSGNSASEAAQQMSGVILASDLLGANLTVSSSTGTGSQGTVQNVIIQPRIGKLQYLVVSLGSADTWIPVPISLMGWDATNNQIVLMGDASLLQNAPGFSSTQLPDTTTAGWDQQFSSYWQNGGSASGNGTGTGTGGTASSTATATP